MSDPLTIGEMEGWYAEYLGLIAIDYDDKIPKNLQNIVHQSLLGSSKNGYCANEPYITTLDNKQRNAYRVLIKTDSKKNAIEILKEFLIRSFDSSLIQCPDKALIKVAYQLAVTEPVSQDYNFKPSDVFCFEYQSNGHYWKTTN